MASCRGCLRYDAAWSLILALDAALTAGGDINDGSVVLDAMKAVSFEGTQNQSQLTNNLLTICAGASGMVSYDANGDRTCVNRECYGLFQLDVIDASLTSQENFNLVAGWDQTNRQLVWQDGVASIPSLVQVAHDTCPSQTDTWKIVLIVLLAFAPVGAAIAVLVCKTGSPKRNAEDMLRQRQIARQARAKLQAATQPKESDAHTTFLSHHKKAAGVTAANLRTLFDRELASAMQAAAGSKLTRNTSNYLDVRRGPT